MSTKPIFTAIMDLRKLFSEPILMYFHFYYNLTMQHLTRPCQISVYLVYAEYSCICLYNYAYLHN